MSLVSTTRGATLLEVLIAVVMVVIVAVGATMLLPKSAQHNLDSRQRLTATALASARLEDIKKTPFDYLDVTTTGLNASCDCRAANFGNPPSTSFAPEKLTSAGTLFTTQYCVNWVVPNAGSWTSQCTESSYKYIRVRVSWNSVTKSQSSIESEGLITRY